MRWHILGRECDVNLRMSGGQRKQSSRGLWGHGTTECHSGKFPGLSSCSHSPNSTVNSWQPKSQCIQTGKADLSPGQGMGQLNKTGSLLASRRVSAPSELHGESMALLPPVRARPELLLPLCHLQRGLGNPNRKPCPSSSQWSSSLPPLVSVDNGRQYASPPPNRRS